MSSREWVRQVIGVVYELVCASLSQRCNQTIPFEKKHDFIFGVTPAEVKTKFPPVDVKHRDEFYPFLNAKLRNPNINLKRALMDTIRVPEIMENDLRCAIERQEGRIICLNFILENNSSILRSLSEYRDSDLTFQRAIDEAVHSITDESQVPLIISFFAVHCNYKIYAITVSIPVKENGKIIIDMSRL